MSVEASLRKGAIAITIHGEANGRLQLASAEGEFVEGGRLQIGDTTSCLRFPLPPALFLDT